MKKMISMGALAITIALTLTGCGGGKSKGNGNGAPGYTHNQLAELFVQNLNATGNFNVTMAKSSTQQKNFIVIYDASTNDYVAVNIDAYDPSQSAQDYFNNNAGRFYYDLDLLPGYYEYQYVYQYDFWCECYIYQYQPYWVPTRYRDRASGFVFEKTDSSLKDLETFAALAEEAVITSRADSVANRFGLSVERSREVVRLAVAWKKMGGKDLTAKDQDAFSKELLGFSITEAKTAAEAVNAGNPKAMDSLIEEAALTNGTTPEHIRQIVDQYFIE